MHPVKQLLSLARIPPVYRLVATSGLLYEVASNLSDKLEMLSVAVLDFDERLKGREGAFQSVEGDPRVLHVLTLPMRRLQLAIEAIPHCVYSTCEVAARLVSALEPTVFQSTFHRIATAVENENAEPYATLRSTLGDLTWYFSAYELRAEWTHGSVSFVGAVPPSPAIIVLTDQRAAKRVFQGKVHLSADDIRKLALEADGAIRRLVSFCTSRYVLPRLDRSELVKNCPRSIQDGRFVLADLTVGEYLAEHGL